MNRRLKKTTSLLALAFLMSLAAPAALPAPPGGEYSISGQWNSNIGAVYNIQQNGNQYTWTAPSLNQSGTGTISGNVVTISGPGWTVRGTITEFDQAGNATKIVGENGVILFRAAGSPAAPVTPPTPTAPPAPQGGVANISGQWNSNIGAVYNIQQNGNQYTWTAPSLNQSGTGTISGNALTLSGPGWTVKGTITERDQAGNATKIVGENGVILFRAISSSAALQVQKLPSLTTKSAYVKKININSATEAQLQTIPGITPLLSQKIVGARPYKSSAALAQAGLNKSQIEALRPYIMVWSPDPTKVKFYRMAPGEKINLNTASDLMLAALPGIGRGLANAIIKSRPFARIQDLMRVKGIKGKTFERLKPLVTV